MILPSDKWPCNRRFTPADLIIWPVTITCSLSFVRNFLLFFFFFNERFSLRLKSTIDQSLNFSFHVIWSLTAKNKDLSEFFSNYHFLEIYVARLWNKLRWPVKLKKINENGERFDPSNNLVFLWMLNLYTLVYIL